MAEGSAISTAFARWPSWATIKIRRCDLDIADSSFSSMPKIQCYVLTRRKEWCLTQDELAKLVGSYREKIRAIENGTTRPTADELMAFAFIFSHTAPDLFPAYADSVQDEVMAAAAQLSKKFERDKTQKGRRKTRLLQDMLARVTSHVEYV